MAIEVVRRTENGETEKVSGPERDKAIIEAGLDPEVREAVTVIIDSNGEIAGKGNSKSITELSKKVAEFNKENSTSLPEKPDENSEKSRLTEAIELFKAVIRSILHCETLGKKEDDDPIVKAFKSYENESPEETEKFNLSQKKSGLYDFATSMTKFFNVKPKKK